MRNKTKKNFVKKRNCQTSNSLSLPAKNAAKISSLRSKIFRQISNVLTREIAVVLFAWQLFARLMTRRQAAKNVKPLATSFLFFGPGKIFSLIRGIIFPRQFFTWRLNRGACRISADELLIKNMRFIIHFRGFTDYVWAREKAFFFQMLTREY